MTQKTNLWITVACVLVAAGIFVIDATLLPLGVAAGVPYVAVVLIALWLPRRQHVLYAAIAVSALTILGYFWSDPGGIPWMVLANRFLALFAIWVTAMVGYQRRRAGETLRMRDRALAATSNGVVITDARQPDNPVVYCNAGYERLTGYCFDEIVGRNCRFLQNDDHDQEGVEEIRAAVKEGRVGKAVIRNYRKDGSLFWNELTISPVHDEEGRLTHFVGVQNDVTAREDADERLRQSEQRLQHLISNCPGTLYTCEPSGDHGVTFVSETITPQFGYEAREFIDDPSFWAGHIHPDDRERVFAGLSKLSEEGHHAYDYRFLHKNGTYRWLHDQSSLVRDMDGNQVEIVGFWIDITGRKQAEEALRQSEARLAEAERVGRVGHWDWEVATNESHLSDEFCRIFGIEPSETRLTLETFLDIVHPDDRENVRSGMASALDKHDRYTVEYRIVRPDGDERLINSDSRISRGQDGHSLRMFGFVRDITDRLQAEEMLRTSEERFQGLFSNASVCIHEIDMSGRLAGMNPAGLRMMDVDDESDVVGLAYLDIVVPEDRKRISRLLARAYEGQPAQFEFTSGDAGPRIFKSSFTPIRDAAGAVVKLMGVSEEITARKRAEKELTTLNEMLEQRVAERTEALFAAEERYKDLYDNAPDMFVSVDAATGSITQCNQTLATATGYTREEIIGRHVWEMYQPECLEQLKNEVFPSFVETGVVRDTELRLKRKDGTAIEVSLNLSSVRDEQGKVLSSRSSWRDITERKQAQEAHRESEERLRAIVNTASDAIVTIDERGIIDSFNQGAEQMFGYTADEVIGHNVCMLMPSPYREAHDDYIGRYLKTGKANVIGIGREVLGRRKDGSTFPGDLSVSEIHDAPVRRFTGIIRDVTERKRAEERLLQSERLAAIGETAAGLAHESRNALQRSQTAIERLERRLRDNQEVLAILGDLQRAQDDLHRHYEDVREFAAPLQLKKESCDLKELVEQVWEELGPMRKGNNVRIHHESAGLDLRCTADRSKLGQAIRNILENSLAARTESVEIRVRYSEEQIEGEPAIRMAIRDNGPGLTREERERIFEAFYTTKTHGTGLGMAIAKRIVEAHGGDSAVGRADVGGTEIVVTLPLRREQ